ncbi:MAG: hypothetical protein QF464_12880, partial [Myxococcota bacterium]|nr:hypothetical protein [Myxococcota bacterium]
DVPVTEPDVSVVEDIAEPVDQAAEPVDQAVEPAPDEQPGRQVHRMTVAQLARSIPVITGGIAWIEDFGEGPIDMLQILSSTLGAPDYLLVTEENLDPSLILAKFVQDAAYRICVNWVTRDAALAASERTLIVHQDWASQDAADIEASLVALQMRFFARKIDLGDAEDAAAITALSDLFHAAAGGAAAGQEATDGWTAVCLAHMTSPEMVLY